MTIGERLKQARRSAGITQAQLAAKSGVKQQMISKLESGKSTSTARAVELAMALDVDAVWLSTGKRAHRLNASGSQTDMEISAGGIKQRERTALTRDEEELINRLRSFDAEEHDEAIRKIRAYLDVVMPKQDD